jgi:hypothetical protein
VLMSRPAPWHSSKPFWNSALWGPIIKEANIKVERKWG